MLPHTGLSLVHSLLWGLLIVGCTENPRQKPHIQQEKIPPAMPAVPTFSGQRAFESLLKQTSFGPRNPNSRGHRECLDYLTATLRMFAEEVRLQNFTHKGYRGENLQLANIVASFRPDLRERLLLCAHWDTRPRADQDTADRDKPILGANDGASGAAVLVELANLLKANIPPVGVDLVFFDGEDYGTEGDHNSYLLGSRHFAATKPPDYLPRFGVLLDMVGDASLELPREGYSVRYAPDIVDLVWNTARDLGIAQFVADVGPEIIDDHLPLNEGGIKTIDLIDFNYPDPSNRYWHTHQDTPEHCSPQSLEAVGTVLTRVIYTQKP